MSKLQDQDRLQIVKDINERFHSYAKEAVERGSGLMSIIGVVLSILVLASVTLVSSGLMPRIDELTNLTKSLIICLWFIATVFVIYGGVILFIKLKQIHHPIFDEDTDNIFDFLRARSFAKVRLKDEWKNKFNELNKKINDIPSLLKEFKGKNNFIKNTLDHKIIKIFLNYFDKSQKRFRAELERLKFVFSNYDVLIAIIYKNVSFIVSTFIIIYSIWFLILQHFSIGFFIYSSVSSIVIIIIKTLFSILQNTKADLLSKTELKITDLSLNPESPIFTLKDQSGTDTAIGYGLVESIDKDDGRNVIKTYAYNTQIISIRLIQWNEDIKTAYSYFGISIGILLIVNILFLSLVFWPNTFLQNLSMNDYIINETTNEPQIQITKYYGDRFGDAQNPVIIFIPDKDGYPARKKIDNIDLINLAERFQNQRINVIFYEGQGQFSYSKERNDTCWVTDLYNLIHKKIITDQKMNPTKIGLIGIGKGGYIALNCKAVYKSFIQSILIINNSASIDFNESIKTVIKNELPQDSQIYLFTKDSCDAIQDLIDTGINKNYSKTILAPNFSEIPDSVFDSFIRPLINEN
jgi:hypothetical protein